MRNIEIDTLKGTACILLVAFHVVGDTPSSGLTISSGVYREINDLLAYIRMPLFTFLSGIVYAYRPPSKDFLAFAKSKARRLLIPMLTVGTLFALIQTITPGTNGSTTNWLMIHIHPVAHFWFIEAIFLIFIFIAICEMLKMFDGIKRYSLVLSISIILYLSDIHIRTFSISGAIYLLPYFLIGMLYQRYHYIKYISHDTGLLLLLLTLSTLTCIGLDLLPTYEKRSIACFLIGATFCSSALSLKIKINWLARIGYHSYSIFIFHIFFTACARILLKKMGIVDINTLFIVSLVAGIIGPMIIERLLNNLDFARVAFLGGPLKLKAPPTKA